MKRAWVWALLCLSCATNAQEVDADTASEVDDLQEQVDAVEAKVEALLAALEQVAERQEDEAAEEPELDADDEPALGEALDSGPPVSEDTNAEGDTPSD